MHPGRHLARTLGNMSKQSSSGESFLILPQQATPVSTDSGGVSRWDGCVRLAPAAVLIAVSALIWPAAPCFAQAPARLTPTSKAPANLEFDAGVKGWRTVLDGVMGGLSTGKITQVDPGLLRFTGELSLENNGGFSQTQTTVPVGTFAGQRGVEVRLRGDGRRYQFDVRSANVRMMAGSYQVLFDTKPDTWMVLELPFDDFKLHSFGQPVRNAAELRPETVESVGITLADKNAGAFAIDLDYIRPLGAATPPQSGDLGTVAKRAGLTTLLALVKAADLELAAGNRYTIFAPTNEAFARLPADKVKFLTSPEGKRTLQKVLQHHVLAMPLDSASLLSRRAVQSLAGQWIAIDAEALAVGGSKIVAADVAFDSGLVHVIDAVLMPELRSLTEMLAAQPKLSTLRTAVEAAGLGAQLSAENPGPWTVLAPSDEAFAALPPGALEALLADRAQLGAVLAAHVIPSAIRRQDMLAQGSARTLSGQTSVNFGLSQGAITAGGAQILVADIEGVNGVLHIIDRVLLPDASATAAKSTTKTAAPADGLAVLRVFDLAIERGVPLFNAGEQAACAAIYELAIGSVVALGQQALTPQAVTTLQTALDAGSRQQVATDRAWLYRRAMDKVCAALAAQTTR